MFERLPKNMLATSVVLVLLVALMNAVATSGSAINLQFSYVLTSTVDPLYGVRLESTVPAVDLALDYINNNSSLLPGYNLTYSAVKHSQCGRRQALDVFFREILRETNLGIVGCACSPATLAIADAVDYWNIPQIACNPLSRLSSLLENSAEDSDHLFQLHSQLSDYTSAIVAFVRHFNWTRMTILSQEGEIYDEVRITLSEALQQENISIIEPKVVQDFQFASITNDLYPPDVRIFFLNMNGSHAQTILCKAHAENMLFPRYVWLTYSDETGTLVRNQSDCGERVLAGALTGLFTLRGVAEVDLRQPQDVAGMLTSVYSSSSHPFTPLAKFVYDSVMTLAIALNKTAEMHRSNQSLEQTDCQNKSGIFTSLENFSFDNDLMGCILLYNLRNTEFDGLTDHVRFDFNGERLNRSLGFYQHRRRRGMSLAQSVLIADFNAETDELSLVPGENNARIFGGRIPPDGKPLKCINALPLPLAITYYILAGLGILFTLVCFLFNVIYRKRKIVKLTSPNLNYFIIVGALFLYGSIYIRVYLTPSELYNNIRCNLQAILNCIGYVLVFAPVLVKMWRVYFIFHNPSPNKKAVKDWHLTIAVLVMVMVIVVMTLLSATIPALRPDLTCTPDKERPRGVTADGITIEYCAWECYNSRLPFIWLALEFVYLILLQVAAIILAFMTRKVKIKALNDSKYVAAIIYITSMVVVGLIVTTFALDSFIVVAEIMFSGGLMLATTVFVGLIFIPKMVALARDPKGEGALKSSTAGKAASSLTTALPNNESHDKSNGVSIELGKGNGLVPAAGSGSDAEIINRLKNKISELESELQSYRQDRV